MSEQPTRACEICGKDISHRGKAAKTCSDECRQVKHKLNKQAQKRRARAREAARRTEITATAEEVAGLADTVAADVLREELRAAINREALTDDVMHDIAQMMRFAPAAIGAAARLMTSTDPDVALKAATLVLKYTMGNPAVAPKPEDPGQAPMQVYFNVPAAGDTTSRLPDQPALEAEVEEERTCGDCHKTKGASEFVGGSDRCQDCFTKMQEEVAARFAPKDPTRPTDEPT